MMAEKQKANVADLLKDLRSQSGQDEDCGFDGEKARDYIMGKEIENDIATILAKQNYQDLPEHEKQHQKRHNQWARRVKGVDCLPIQICRQYFDRRQIKQATWNSRFEQFKKWCENHPNVLPRTPYPGVEETEGVVGQWCTTQKSRVMGTRYPALNEQQVYIFSSYVMFTTLFF